MYGNWASRSGWFAPSRVFRLACPSPKPRPPRLASVRAVLTGRKKLRTRREAKVVGILWPSTLPGGTRFSGGGEDGRRPEGRREAAGVYAWVAVKIGGGGGGGTPPRRRRGDGGRPPPTK